LRRQGLQTLEIDEVNVRYADNSVRRKEVYGWIILEIVGRKAVFDVLAAANRTDSVKAIGFDYRANYEKGHTQGLPNSYNVPPLSLH